MSGDANDFAKNEPSDELWARLRELDTPTVCNAIEVVEGKRGFEGFTRRTPVASPSASRAMLGYARTGRIRGNAPSTEPPERVRKRRMDYYRYMSEGPRPALAVIEDVDYPDCRGAYWGEVNAVVHQGFGLGGALTNGLMRDLGDLPEGFPVVAGAVGPSHGFVHVLDIDRPVSVLGLTVAPGDLIHADRHGAVVIPPAVVSGLSAAIDRLLATERLILEPAIRPDFDFEAFERAWTAFEKARV